MAIFLILGIALGVVSVIFVLQNVTPVTVTFLAWQLGGSLALILFLAVMSGVLMTLLFLLPRFIRDEWQFSKLKKNVRSLEEELAKRKTVEVAEPQPFMTGMPPKV